MDYIKAKIYELLIRLRLKLKLKLNYKNVKFKYFIEIRFITQIVKPNTKSYVTVYYELPKLLGTPEENLEKFKIFENIKEAYKYFK